MWGCFSCFIRNSSRNTEFPSNIHRESRSRNDKGILEPFIRTGYGKEQLAKTPHASSSLRQRTTTTCQANSPESSAGSFGCDSRRVQLQSSCRSTIQLQSSSNDSQSSCNDATRNNPAAALRHSAAGGQAGTVHRTRTNKLQSKYDNLCFMVHCVLNDVHYMYVWFM